MYTWGMAKFPGHQDLLPRLKRVEGQIPGISRMVEEGRYCIDILQQLTAVRSAVNQVSMKVMKAHINGCVSQGCPHARRRQENR